MVASGHFQDSIEPPSAFDIVVLIVWSRLGTPLPERTKVREYRGIDGRAPVTGTEWEYEEALKAAREVAGRRISWSTAAAQPGARSLAAPDRLRPRSGTLDGQS